MFNLVPFLSYVFVTTFTPGPNNIMSMTNANRYGFRKTLPFNFGVFAGFIIILLLCTYFDLLLLNLLPRIQLGMEVLGATYMAYLAYLVITSKPKISSDDASGAPTFISGMLLQFVNPKVILYGITVVSSFILPIYKSDSILITFSILLALLGLISTCCWSLFGSLFQGYLAKYQRPVNFIMGILLLYCAISVLL